MKHSLNLCLLAFCLLLQLRTSSATNYYVSPTGTDSNEGTNVALPFKTIAHALRMVHYGDTIYLRDGTYRERIWAPAKTLPGLDGGEGSTSNMLSIARYSTNEFPTFKGSVIVTNWQSDGGFVWKVSGWSNRSQQVFVNERLLTHLGWNAPINLYPYGDVSRNLASLSKVSNPIMKRRTDMVPGTFFHDTNTWTLYVQLFDNENPNTRTMEVSVGIPWGIGYPFVRMEGLNFRHSSVLGSSSSSPSVILDANSIIQNSAVEWCDFGGLALRENSQMLNCRIANNGMIGFSIGSNSVVRGCTVVSNHYMPFDLRGEAAGTKIIAGNKGQGDNLIIENNEFGWNINCPGIWFDKMNNSNAPAIIRGNDIHHNGDGIMIEISTNYLVYNNLIDANAYRGIYFSQAVDCRVFNNTIIVPYTAPSNPNYQLVCALAISGGWGGRSDRYASNIFITKNLIYDDTVYRTSALRTVAYTRGPTTTNIYLDYNCYYARNASNKTAVRFNINPYTDLKIGGKTNYMADLAGWRTNAGPSGNTFDAHSIAANPLKAARRGRILPPREPKPMQGRGIYVANVTLGVNIIAGVTNNFSDALKSAIWQTSPSKVYR